MVSNQYPRLTNIILMLMMVFWNNLDTTWANDTTKLDHSEKYKMCTSQICEKSGVEIISSLDNTINPCDNFYQHTCGNWANSHPISVQTKRSSHILEILNHVQNQTLEMLEGNDTAESETLRKVRDFYKSCINSNNMRDGILIPLASLVSANGGWPLSYLSQDSRLEDQNSTLQKVLENYIKIGGYTGILDIFVYASPFKPRDYTLALHATPQPLWFEDDKSMTIPYLAQFFGTLRGINRAEKDMESEIAKMINFSDTLKDTSNSYRYNTSTNSTEEKITIVELQNTWSKAVSGHPEYAINWLEMIREIFDGANMTINETEEIAIAPKNFIPEIAELLKNTTLRTVVNYIHSNVIVKMMNEASRGYAGGPRMTNAHDIERRRHCAETHGMVEGIFYAYARRYLPANLSPTITQMASKIVDEMKRLIKQSTWIDNESKPASIEKIDNMLKFIGNPSWYDEPGKMDKFYSELKIGSNYFENLVNIARFNTMTRLKKLKTSHYERDINQVPIGVVNLYYDSDRNAIISNPMHLQLPLYHPERPPVLNFGYIGTMIGHEAAHVFRKNGILGKNWRSDKSPWSNSTKAKYNEKLKCYVEQYSNYTIHESNENKTWHVDGNITLHENIPDNAGFATALNAYISFKKQPSFQDIRIPALKNFTDMQLFFYSLSNVWCGVIPDSDIPTVMHVKHTFEPARVNVFLRNTPKFSEAFNCPIGSPMNPSKKCIFWE